MLNALKEKVCKLFAKIDKKDLIILLIIISISAIAHGWNMFNYPSYFDDEGTYMSQAYSFATQGKLAPYTYWYDHSPLGWMVIAGWLKLTYELVDFNNLIDSGRVFMLIIQILSTVFVFKIIEKITKSHWPAVIGALLFALSPVGIPLHRMVMLDNIMVMFLLASILLILKTEKMSRYIWSSILFGAAVLCKESAIFFLPAFIICIYLQCHKNQRKMTLISWGSVFSLVIFLYLLFAMLKGELFPHGVFGDDAVPHVSLIETLSWQSSRKGGFFLSSDSEFMFALRNSWLPTDSPLLITGTVSTLAIVIWGLIKRNWNYLLLGLLSVLYIFYLTRGGIVNDQYLIPLIPLFSICISMLLYTILQNLFVRSIKFKLLATAILLTILMPFMLVYAHRTQLYNVDFATHQRHAYQWYLNNIDMDSFSSVDGYMISDFLVNRSNDIYNDSGPQHYWKVDQDPALTDKFLHNNWMNIEYAVTSSKVERETRTQAGLPMLTELLDNSKVIALFIPKESISTNNQITLAYSGPIKIYQRKSYDEIILNNSWKSYKKVFIKSYGQVLDPETKSTTSEGQSYAMIRAERQNDKVMFDGFWQWTTDHMQHRTSDKLFSWQWTQLKNGTFKQTDSNSATDADIDIAYALLRAFERWGDVKYKVAAIQVLNDIWKKEIKEIDGRYVTLSSADQQGELFRINPSYYSPYQFKYFAKYDKTHDWQRAADDSYAILRDVQDLSPIGLFPNWAYIDNTGRVSSGTVKDENTYGYDAFRINWRLGLDLKFNKDEQARAILAKINSFYSEQVEKSNDIYAAYNLQGVRSVEYLDVAPMSAVSINAYLLNDSRVSTYANNYLNQKFNSKAYSWGDANNYYNQNWAWFALDLQSNNK